MLSRPAIYRTLCLRGVLYYTLMGKRNAVVIGAGLGGISAAAYLARDGYAVTVIEQLGEAGGRAQVWRGEGFRFDIGPSWYWMPDDHDEWFRSLGFQRSEYYRIIRLNPSFKVFFNNHSYCVPAGEQQVSDLFERISPGYGERLSRYLALCRQRYEISRRHFIYKQYRSLWGFVDPAVLAHWRTIRLFRSYHNELLRHFQNTEILKILAYPVVFLGADTHHTPAVYTLMNWVDIGLGTWYPEGGFGAVIAAMRSVAEELGVRFVLNRKCIGFTYRSGRKSIEEVVSVPSGNRALTRNDMPDGDGAGAGETQAGATATQAGATASHAGAGETQAGATQANAPSGDRAPHADDGQQTLHPADVVVANGDYYSIERLLPRRLRSYSSRYWRRRALSPGVLNFYIGLDVVIPELEHHTFFFDGDWEGHFAAVYKNRPPVSAPLFYLHYPTATDSGTAPAGCSALFILIPIAAGSPDGAEMRTRYFTHCCERIAQKTGCDIRPHIRVQRSMSITEFQNAYSALEGNAFGLGHTLGQTAGFRPRNKSRHIDNLYYSGHYTTPGTGTTMSTISGKLTAARVAKEQGGQG